MTTVEAGSSVEQWQYWIFDPDAYWDKEAGVFRAAGLPDGLTTWDEVLNALGRLGWELVSVTDRPAAHMSHAARTLFFLKRRAASEAA